MTFCILYKDHCYLSASLPYSSCPNSTEQITKHRSRLLQSPTYSLYHYRPMRLSETALWEDRVIHAFSWVKWTRTDTELSVPLCIADISDRSRHQKSQHTGDRHGEECKHWFITDKSWPSRKWQSRNMPASHLQCFKWRTWTWFNISIFNYLPIQGKETFQFQKHLGFGVKL